MSNNVMVCNSCKDVLTASKFVCHSCAQIHPITKEINYFSLFSLEEKFDIFPDELLEKYLSLQRIFHPDNFVVELEQKKILALNYTIFINKAYEVLKSDRKRAEYLLLLRGIRVNSEHGDNIKPSEEMLQEVLCWREMIVDSESLDSIEELKNKLPNTEKLFAEFKKNYELGDYHQAALTIIALRYLEKTLEEIKTKTKTFYDNY